jgi:hypothetical protein
MVRQHLRWLAPLVVVVALGAWLLQGRRAPAPTARPAGSARSARGGQATALPRIDLARLTAPRAEASVGRRDLFGFGSAAPKPDEEAESEVAPATLAGEASPPAEPTPAPAPVLNVKYIGSLESRQGLKLAVLLTDRREVLWGQAGDLVANRFRIVKIGLESVDIQEVGSERIRRIPLRGN